MITFKISWDWAFPSSAQLELAVYKLVALLAYTGTASQYTFYAAKKSTFTGGGLGGSEVAVEEMTNKPKLSLNRVWAGALVELGKTSATEGRSVGAEVYFQ